MKTRPIKIIKNYIQHAEGSCLISMGNTMVLCTATIEAKVPPHIEKQGIVNKGWVTGEYSLLPRAGKERTPRNKGASGGRSQEISRLIGRSLRAVVDLQKIGKRTIILDCDVIKADGGTRTTSINGAFIALYMALSKLYKNGDISEWPIADYLGAVSVGLKDGKVILDLDAASDNTADVDLNVVMTGTGKFIEVQGTAEGQPFTKAELDKLVLTASAGIKSIIKKSKEILKPK